MAAFDRTMISLASRDEFLSFLVRIATHVFARIHRVECQTESDGAVADLPVRGFVICRPETVEFST